MEDTRGITKYSEEVTAPDFSFAADAGWSSYVCKNNTDYHIRVCTERAHVGQGNHSYYDMAPYQVDVTNRERKQRCVMVEMNNMEYAITGCPRHLEIHHDKVCFRDGFSWLSD